MSANGGSWFGVCATVVALACAGASCSRAPDSFRPEKVGDLSREMWQRVGRELASAASPMLKKGGRVLLVRASAEASVAPDQDVMEEVFKRGLGASAEVVVRRVPDAPRPEWAQADYPVLPGPLETAWLAEALSKEDPISVVVSLVGEPAGRGAFKGPPVVCFSPAGGDRLAALIRAGSVAAAVASRRDAPPSDEQDWFALRYTVVTPANVEAWAGSP